MNLELHFGGRNFAEALHTYLERRLQFALSAFAGHIGLVTLRLADTSHRNQPLQHCEIRAELIPGGSVVVREAHPDLYVAVDRAVRRTVRLLRKQSDRSGRPQPILGGRFRSHTRTPSGFRCRQGGPYAVAD